MAKYATPKFSPDQKVRVGGQEGVVQRICKRAGWASPQIPEFRVQFAGGVRVVRQSDLAPTSTPVKSNGRPQGVTAAAETAPQILPIPAAARPAVHTTQLVKVPAPAAPEPVGKGWPSGPIKATTYRVP